MTAGKYVRRQPARNNFFPAFVRPLQLLRAGAPTPGGALTGPWSYSCRVTLSEIETKLNIYAPMVVSVYRMFLGLIFLCHGTAHLFGWPTGHAAGVGSWPLWYAGIIELITGILITAGFYTRTAALIASGTMAFAYFSVHSSGGFWPIVNGGESAVLLCFGFFLLVFTGGGTLTVDALRKRLAYRLIDGW